MFLYNNNESSNGDHLAMYKNTKSLFFMLEINILSIILQFKNHNK